MAQIKVQLSGVSPQSVSLISVMLRIGTWSFGFLKFSSRYLNLRRRGKVTDRQLGQILRRMLEEVGGTSVKFGQQLSLRVDMIPFEVCEELDGLLDSVPPFKLSSVTDVLEEALGAPIDQVFAHIDPEPIGSASIASVFKARLHDGRDVAVKVRRPTVHTEFKADLIVFNVLTRIMEVLTIVRVGFFHHLRSELWSMLTDELDFLKEADLQQLFRASVKEYGLKWVTAPEVYGQWSNDSVLVTEFIDGLPAGDLLAAIERGDTEQLKAWRARKISPRAVAKNLLELSFWGQFEAPFFHADPHPGNIIIKPNNQIVMLDFGACGHVPYWQRGSGIEFHKRAMERDFGGAAQMGIASNIPLPYVDIDEVVTRMQDVFWRSAIARMSNHCDWWERTSAAGWQKTIEALGEFNIQANAETLRTLRANLLYETLVSRIDPDLDPETVAQRWMRRSGKRAHYRLEDEFQRRGPQNMAEEWGARFVEFARLMRAGAVVGQITTTRMPPDFRNLVSAAAFAFSKVLSTTITAVNLFILASIGVFMYENLTGVHPLLLDVMYRVAVHPITVFSLGFMALRCWRRIRHRLLMDKVRND